MKNKKQSFKEMMKLLEPFPIKSEKTIESKHDWIPTEFLPQPNIFHD
jgi:hypothetical protein